MKIVMALFVLGAILPGCASPRPRSAARVAVLEVNSVGGATVVEGDRVVAADDVPGAQAVLERQLLLRGIALVGNSAALRILRANLHGCGTSVGDTRGFDWTSHRIMRTNVGLITRVDPQYPVLERGNETVYGLIVTIRHNIGLFSVLTLGFVPHTIDIVVRVIDIRTGNVRAIETQEVMGSVYSSRGIYRGMKRAGDGIAASLARLDGTLSETEMRSPKEM